MSCAPIIPRARFVTDVQAILQDALRLRDRHLHGRVSAHGLAVARGQLVERLHQRLDRPGTVTDVHRFAAHLAVEWPALFTFLFDPSAIDATNWRAEQALRPAVVTKKVCGGNRSPVGAETQQILASVLRTASAASAQSARRARLDAVRPHAHRPRGTAGPPAIDSTR